MAATRRSVQQVFAATAATVSPPSDWPVTAISCELISPGEQAAVPGAEREHPGDHIGHIGRLVDHVGLGRRRADLAVRAREVHRGDHVAGGGPGLQQPGVRAAALHESRTEHDQRERPAGGFAGLGRRAGQRVPDLRQQPPRTEVLTGRTGVGRLGERDPALTDPELAQHADPARGTGRYGTA